MIKLGTEALFPPDNCSCIICRTDIAYVQPTSGSLAARPYEFIADHFTSFNQCSVIDFLSDLIKSFGFNV